jgi:hypothetical protein
VVFASSGTGDRLLDVSPNPSLVSRLMGSKACSLALVKGWTRRQRGGVLGILAAKLPVLDSLECFGDGMTDRYSS